MTSRTIRTAARILGGTVLAVILLGGCQRVEIAMTVEPDGGGSRTVTVEVDDDRDDGRQVVPEVVELFGLTRDAGWERVAAGDGDRNAGKVAFHRADTVADPAGWAVLGGVLRVRAGHEGSEYADVRLGDEVSLVRGESGRGRTYDYRETFAWNDLREVLTGFLASCFVARIETAHPELRPVDTAELRGLVAGRLIGDWDRLATDDEGIQEAVFGAAATDLAPQVVRILRRAGVQDDPPAVRELLLGVLGDDDGEMDRFLEDSLPGVDAAVLTTVTVRLRLPGTVVDSNADEAKDGVLSWEVDLSEAVKGPVVLYARSESASE